MINSLLTEALSEDSELHVHAPPLMLFLLSQYADGDAKVTERFQLGMGALHLWHRKKVPGWARYTHFLNRRSKNGKRPRMACGLLHLAALALFIDLEPRHSRPGNKIAKFAAVEEIVCALNRMEFDPTFPTMFLLEVMFAVNVVV